MSERFFCSAFTDPATQQNDDDISSKKQNFLFIYWHLQGLTPASHALSLSLAERWPLSIYFILKTNFLRSSKSNSCLAKSNFFLRVQLLIKTKRVQWTLCTLQQLKLTMCNLNLSRPFFPISYLIVFSGHLSHDLSSSSSSSTKNLHQHPSLILFLLFISVFIPLPWIRECEF